MKTINKHFFVSAFACALLLQASGLCWADPSALPRAVFTAQLQNVTRLDARALLNVGPTRWLLGARWDLLGVTEQVAPAGYTRTDFALRPIEVPQRVWAGFAGPGLVFGPVTLHGRFARLLDPTAGGASSARVTERSGFRLDTSLRPSPTEGAWLGVDHADRSAVGSHARSSLTAALWHLSRPGTFEAAGIEAGARFGDRSAWIHPWLLLSRAAFAAAGPQPDDPWRNRVAPMRAEGAAYAALGLDARLASRLTTRLEGWRVEPHGEQSSQAAGAYLRVAEPRRSVALVAWAADASYRPLNRNAASNLWLVGVNAGRGPATRRATLDVRLLRPIDTARAVQPPRLEAELRARTVGVGPIGLTATFGARAVVADPYAQAELTRYAVWGAWRLPGEWWSLGMEHALRWEANRREVQLGMDLSAHGRAVAAEAAATVLLRERGEAPWQREAGLRAAVRVAPTARNYLRIAGVVQNLSTDNPDWTAVSAALLRGESARAELTLTVHRTVHARRAAPREVTTSE